MNARPILLLLATLVMANMPSLGIPSAASPHRLEKPDCIRELGKAPEDIHELNALLKENKLKEFYQKARELYLHHDPDRKNIESISYFFWFSYSIAAAPRFPFEDDDSTTIATFNDNIDLQLIQDTFDSFLTVARNELPHFVREQSLDRKQLAHLFSLYAARMLRDLRSIYATDLSAWEKNAERKNKQQALEEKKKLMSGEVTLERAQKFMYKGMDWSRNIRNKQTLNNNRKGMCQYMIEKMEAYFVSTLVILFPGKKGEVINYIRMAGYRDDEINSLIDRSVGRDPTTEFLYKGRSKKDARQYKPKSRLEKKSA